MDLENFLLSSLSVPTFPPQTAVGSTWFQVHVPSACLNRRCSTLSCKCPPGWWGASFSSPHALVIMPVKGQCGSPLSFLIKAALAENPKKEEAPQWVRAEGALRLPWLPAGTCVRSPALRSKCSAAHHEAFQPTPGQLAHERTQADPPLATSQGLGFWVHRIITPPSQGGCLVSKQ